MSKPSTALALRKPKSALTTPSDKSVGLARKPNKSLTRKQPNKSLTRTGKWKDKFLRELAKWPHVGEAARAARVSRDTCYNWKARDEDFSRAWDEALTVGVHAVADLVRTFVKTALKPGGDPRNVAAAARLAELELRSHLPAYRERVEAAVAGGIIILPAKAQGAE